MKHVLLLVSIFLFLGGLVACTSQPTPKEQKDETSQEENKEQDNSQGWEYVGTEGYRMLATINDVKVNSVNFINSLMIEGIEKIPYNYHTDWQAKGTKQQIVFDEELTEFAKNHLAKGQKIVITYGQWAIPPEGKVVMGSQLNSIVFVMDGELYNYKGEEYKQEDKAAIEKVLQENNSSCETAPETLNWMDKEYTLETENTNLEPAMKYGYVKCSNGEFTVVEDEYYNSMIVYGVGTRSNKNDIIIIGNWGTALYSPVKSITKSQVSLAKFKGTVSRIEKVHDYIGMEYDENEMNKMAQIPRYKELKQVSIQFIQEKLDMEVDRAEKISQDEKTGIVMVITKNSYVFKLILGYNDKHKIWLVNAIGTL